MSDTETSSVDSTPKRSVLTIEKLLEVLQEILAEDPDAKKMPVYHSEFGGITRSYHVEVCDEINGKKVKRFLILE